MKAVILAGGKGTRLYPYTVTLPKPLVPIGDKPILEIILGQLKRFGIDEVILAIGHMAEVIVAIFKNKSDFGVNMKFSVEDKPLGTAGPLKLLEDELKDTFLVMNGDVLTDMNLKKLIDFHKKEKAIATIALARRKVKIDFGVVEIDLKGLIKKYLEKPEMKYLVSMGIYVFEPKVLEYIPDSKFDFPDLVMKLLNSGERVRGYIHDGYWLDIGRPEDYEKACRDYGKLTTV